MDGSLPGVHTISLYVLYIYLTLSHLFLSYDLNCWINFECILGEQCQMVDGTLQQCNGQTPHWIWKFTSNSPT